MKNLKNLKKASFVVLSALVLTLGLAAAPKAFADSGDKGDRKDHKEHREDRGDKRDDRSDRRDNRGDKGDNDNSADMDWDNTN
jgi:hypothetical protein